MFPVYRCPSAKLAVYLLPILFVLASCGGGGGAQTPAPVLDAAVPSLAYTQVRLFSFSWIDDDAATHYRLLENPDGASGYTQIGADVLAGVQQLDIAVPLARRINASYILQSCDTSQCLDSAPLAVSGNLADSIGYLKASASGAGDQFGYAVALSGDGNTLAVGAPSEDSASTGINGDETDNGAGASGAVYVFGRAPGGWEQQAYIKPHNTGTGDQFGFSVDLDADGDTLAVGARWEGSDADLVDGDGSNNAAPQAGAAYVFTRSAGAWSQQAYIKAPDSDSGDLLGWSLGLSANGDRLVVSAPGEASAATGVGGNSSDNSAPSAGAAYLFERSGSSWYFAEYFKASNAQAGDSAGFSVALSGDGLTIALGAHAEASAETGMSANPADNSAAFAGATYVFADSAGSWLAQAYVKSSNTDANDRFGWSVSLDNSGDVLAVSTYAEESAAQGIGGDPFDNSAADSGAVYLFERSAGTWSQQHYIKSPNSEALDLFGFTVKLSGDGNTLLAGAYGESSAGAGVMETTDTLAADNSSADAGAAYLYTRNGVSWQALRYLKPGNPDANDLFGWALDIDNTGNVLAVGAQRESSAASGISADQSDNTAGDAGAVYLY